MVHRKDAKDWARANVKGLWTSPTVPFTPDFEQDEAGIRNNVERMLQTRTAGIGMGFSEPWSQSHEERKRSIEVSVDAIRGRVPAYAHVTDHSVPDTIALGRHAQNAGADAVMVWAPYEWAKTQDMIYEYYEYVASQLDIAIFAYNTPHSGTIMTPETIARLAKIPNICAVKDGINDVDHAVECMKLCGDEIIVSVTTESHLLNMTLNHGQQALLGTTAIFLMQSPDWQPIQQYWELAMAGKSAEAKAKFDELEPLRDLWRRMYASLRDPQKALHPVPMIKYWMDLIGMSGGTVRPPMHPATQEQKTWLEHEIESSGLMSKLYPKRAAAE